MKEEVRHHIHEHKKRRTTDWGVKGGKGMKRSDVIFPHTP